MDDSFGISDSFGKIRITVSIKSGPRPKEPVDKAGAKKRTANLMFAVRIKHTPLCSIVFFVFFTTGLYRQFH